MKQKPIIHFLPLFGFLLLCIAIISLGTSLVRTIQRRAILETRQTELTKLQEKNKELDKNIHLVESPEFIEKEAREKLNLAKPGETIILINQVQQENRANQESGIQTTTWKKWWGVFF